MLKKDGNATAFPLLVLCSGATLAQNNQLQNFAFWQRYVENSWNFSY
jgi:hypothetical protein